MKHNLLLTLSVAALCSLSAVAQTLIPDQNDKGKWGFVDNSGKVVVKYNYDSATAFNDGFARVGKNEKWGYINADGKEVLKPEYDEITAFTNGVARVKKGKTFGFINTKMEFVVPCKFSSVGSFNQNGLVWVQDGKKYGIYRADGSVVLKPNYKSMGYFIPFEYTYNADQLKDVAFADKTHYQHDPTHHSYQPVELEYKVGEAFPTEAVGIWYTSNAGFLKNGVMDLQGNEIVAAGKYVKAFYPSDGFAKVITKTNGNGYDVQNFLNTATGALLLKDSPAFEWCFNDGVALVEYFIGSDGKPATKRSNSNKSSWYFVDTNGNRINATPYDEVFARNSDTYVVKKNDKYGMVDKHGHEILAPTYAVILAGSDGMFGASTDKSKYGYLNNQGAWVIQPTYDAVNVGKHGFLPVSNDKRWGYVDHTGKVIVPVIYNGLKFPSSSDAELIWVRVGQKYSPHSVKGQKLAFTSGYTGVYDFGQDFDGVALVNDGENKFGCIDTEGNEIVPLEFADYDLVKAVYAEMQRSGAKAYKPSIGHRARLSLQSKDKSFRLKQTLDNTNWQY